MLIHITPRIYIPSAVKSCEMTGLKIEQLGVSFSAEQIATRKPYPNKRFHVACRRNNRRAVQGLLFSVGAAPREFTVEQWVKVNSPRGVAFLDQMPRLQRQQALSRGSIHVAAMGSVDVPDGGYALDGIYGWLTAFAAAPQAAAAPQ